MPLTIKTQDELVRIFKDHIRGIIPGADTSPGSDYDLMARVAAAVFRGNQGQAKFLVDQILPGTCEDAYVTRHANWRKLTPQPAAGAQGNTRLTAPSGTDIQPEGSTMTHADGTVYELTAPATIHMPTWSGKVVAEGSTRSRLIVSPNTTGMAAGDMVIVASTFVTAIKSICPAISAIDLWTGMWKDPEVNDTIAPYRGVVASIRAQTTGASTNKSPPEELEPDDPEGDGSLTLDSPVGDINETSFILRLSGGGDAETTAELRSRVQAYDTQGIDATAEHYRQLARTCPNVRLADAIVFPNFRGMGAHTIQLIGIEGARLVSQPVVDTVQEWIDEHAAAGDDVEVEALDYDEQFVLWVGIYPRSGYEPDFANENFLAKESGSTTTKICLMSDPTGIIQPNHRTTIIMDPGGAEPRGFQRKVLSVGSDYIVIDVPLPEVVADEDQVLPAGPLTEPVLEALEAMFDSFGPRAAESVTDDTDLPQRHPTPDDAWGEWFIDHVVIATCLGIEGVHDVKMQDDHPGYGKRLARGIGQTLKAKGIIVQYD